MYVYHTHKIVSTQNYFMFSLHYKNVSNVPKIVFYDPWSEESRSCMISSLPSDHSEDTGLSTIVGTNFLCTQYILKIEYKLLTSQCTISHRAVQSIQNFQIYRNLFLFLYIYHLAVNMKETEFLQAWDVSSVESLMI